MGSTETPPVLSSETRRSLWRAMIPSPSHSILSYRSMTCGPVSAVLSVFRRRMHAVTDRWGPLAFTLFAGADVVGVGFVSGSGGGGGGDGVRTRRVDDGCAGADDIAIYQGRATPLPSGVPAYTVDVMNRCAGGGGGDEECAIAGIHVRCGWFSSVSLVDPRVFRRLGHDDCLLNDGRPLLAGETVSFEYTNSFPYKLSVSVATCVVDPAAP